MADGPAARRGDFDGKRFLEVERMSRDFGYLDRSRSLPGSSRIAKGGILSQQEDYFEGTGHALYLIDGKIRLHVVFRWTDLALRLETVEAGQTERMAACAGHLRRQAQGVAACTST